MFLRLRLKLCFISFSVPLFCLTIYSFLCRINLSSDYFSLEVDYLKAMENVTVNKSTYFYRESVWYGNMIISIICLPISFYVLCAMIFYEEKVQNWRKISFFQQSKAEKYGSISKFLSILIALFSLARHAITTTMVWIEVKPSPNENFSHLPYIKQACREWLPAGIFILSAGLSFVYLFLWFRQRIFYTHPALKVLNNQVVQQTSNFVLVIWFMYFVAVCTSYFVLVRYEFNDIAGCLVRNDTLISYQFIIGSWALVSIFMQVILLGLFIHPLRKRASWSGQTPSQKIRLQQSVKKAVILAVICLISDILIPIITLVLLKPNENDIYTIYNFNIIINHLVTVACFDQWKTMLWPWKHLKTESTNRSISSGTIEDRI